MTKCCNLFINPKMKIFSFNSILLILFVSLSKSIEVFQEVEEKQQEFRGVWSSPWGGDADLITYKSEEQFKNNMTYILDTIKMYNMNALIYHVRTHDDALYQSTLNPISPYFKDVDYSEFDPLKWLIDETHRRGIDFHAWMNPYRISSNKSLPIDQILEKYRNYQNNPASDRNCILKGVNSIIMDPGLDKVRTFIAETMIEFLNKYDVEAIHFDDYFYDDMGANGTTSGDRTILDEADQETYHDYINNHPDCPYKVDNATDKADWRRYQVDLLIKLLKDKIDEYNTNKNKHVQFGISPTGIWRNGDGIVGYDKNHNAITTGSDTNGQQHWGDYLFCDTLKWCNEGWIDYILPQNYFARNSPNAPFEKILDWWDKVLKYKNVNLYQGVGLYQADETKERYSWHTNDYELYEDLQDTSKSYRTDGVSIYNLHTLRSSRDKKQTNSSKQIENGMNAWTKKVPLSEIKSFERIILDAPQNVTFENSTLSFDKVECAKFYIIYRNKGEVKFTTDEIIDMVGNPENKDRLEWKENNPDDYKYRIRVLSYTNTLSEIDKNPNTSKIIIVPFIGLCFLMALIF